MKFLLASLGSVRTSAVRYSKFALFTAVILITTSSQAQLATALEPATSNANSGAKVSFTFDDGNHSAWQYAAPVLAQFGYVGTSYVTTGFVGQEGYMNWNQVKRLQNERGWEIGSHSVTHPLLTEVSSTQLETEMRQSKQMLATRGIQAKSFASPYGDYNNAVMAAAARHYENHRGFHDQGDNYWPYSDYLLQVRQVQRGISVDQVKQYINDAKAKDTWLILVFHDIKADTVTLDDYDYKRGDLRQVAQYVRDQQLPVTTVGKGTAARATNMFGASGDFDAGLGGWTTDAPSNITPVAGRNGATPSPTAAVRMISAPTKNIHLFSPQVSVSSDRTYLFKSFLNTETITTSAVGYYIDEYDANGNWISGQYKAEEPNSFVESINFTYTPTSANVKHAQLQVILTSGSGSRVFVDGFKLYDLAS
jgi:peptidoglycan/xylan/chitin deacetylase (PgdA/CDA1 family)